jgi:hypothetical protein
MQMPIIVENKLITLNSAYSSKQNDTYNSRVLFNFKGILTDEVDIVSSNICVMNAQIPVSFYTINDGNNIIGTDKGNVVIPVGNYNFNSLAPVVVSAFQTQISVDITFIISKFTGLVEFTYVGLGLANTYFNFNNSYRIFGFLPNVNYPYVGSSRPSLFPLNLLGIKKLNIQSQKLQINSFSSATSNLGITLATIPVDQPAFSMISYSSQTDLNKSALQTSYIDQIDISIVDEDDNLINFNGIDWSITLVLENRRLLPDRFTTPFRELTTPVDSVKMENPDIKDLELLSA